MAIRISTIDVPRFIDGGLDVGQSWTRIEMSDEQRAALVAHVGRFVQIHPDDVGALSEFGLELVDGKLLEAKKTTPTPTKKSGARAEKE